MEAGSGMTHCLPLPGRPHQPVAVSGAAAAAVCRPLSAVHGQGGQPAQAGPELGLGVVADIAGGPVTDLSTRGNSQNVFMDTIAFWNRESQHAISIRGRPVQCQNIELWGEKNANTHKRTPNLCKHPHTRT